jgi:hypothetical protein
MGSIQHPFFPNVDWTIAISRRFTGEKATRLYADVFEPVLHRHGLVLQCNYASDNSHSPDYWVDRITSILAVTELHVLFDINRSGYVEYEFEKSRQQAFRGGTQALAEAHGWSPRTAFMLRPYRVLVTDSELPLPLGGRLELASSASTQPCVIMKLRRC